MGVMTEIEYSGDELTIGGERIELPASINQCLEFDGLVVVRLDTLGKSNDPRNVWAFDRDGSLEWKIESVEPTGGSENPYTHITVEEGVLWASNWDGHRYEIDVESGEMLDREVTM